MLLNLQLKSLASRDRGRQISESEVSHGYRVSSRITRATQTKPVSEQTNKQNDKKQERQV